MSLTWRQQRGDNRVWYHWHTIRYTISKLCL